MISGVITVKTWEMLQFGSVLGHNDPETLFSAVALRHLALPYNANLSYVKEKD